MDDELQYTMEELRKIVEKNRKLLEQVGRELNEFFDGYGSSISSNE